MFCLTSPRLWKCCFIARHYRGLFCFSQNKVLITSFSVYLRVRFICLLLFPIYHDTKISNLKNKITGISFSNIPGCLTLHTRPSFIFYSFSLVEMEILDENTHSENCSQMREEIEHDVTFQ